MNAGATPVDVIAVFPATSVRMDLVERNPGPGTEGAAPRAVTVDLTTGAVIDRGPTDLPADYRS